MPRPICPRYVEEPARVDRFKPAGIPARDLEEVVLGMDELEALRLADLEGLYQEAAAERMNISRPTFGRLIASARRKVAEALVEGKALRIEGGVVEMPNERLFECASCSTQWSAPFGTGRPRECPSCHGENIHRAGGGQGQGHRCRRRMRGGRGRTSKGGIGQ
jgi:predicted DNA-binding protein (UPF0251 family)